jgi:hypothetical protein
VPGAKSSKDFDEAADGEPVLMADAWALVEGNSNAVAGDRHQFFFGWQTSGEAQAVALAAHRGAWALARAAVLSCRL